MSVTVLSTIDRLKHLSLPTPCEVGTDVAPILQMGEKGLEQLSHLSKVLQLGGRRNGISTDAV